MMLPSEPPRRPQLGFLYVPPYRVQGISIAGEESAVHLPELDVCFDIGLCPRAVLPSRYVALTHGHMDHAAALSYYFSQRHFQGMGEGSVICHAALEQPIHNLMRAWVDLEMQRTPYHIFPLKPDEQLQIKNHILLRAFATRHTPSSLGFVIIEKRSKLRSEFIGLAQEQLVALKKQGTEITETRDIPLVCYTGDTAWGEHFDRQDVLESKILITECTFVEPLDHNRAGVGRHLHLGHIVQLLEKSQAEAVILTHLSRRTHLAVVRQALDDQIPAAHRDRVFLLMDSRANRQRYERQVAEES